MENVLRQKLCSRFSPAVRFLSSLVWKVIFTPYLTDLLQESSLPLTTLNIEIQSNANYENIPIMIIII